MASRRIAAFLLRRIPAKPHGEPTHRGKFRPFAFERVNLHRLIVCQQPAWLDAERCRDDRRDRSSSRIDSLRPWGERGWPRYFAFWITVRDLKNCPCSRVL